MIEITQHAATKARQMMSENEIDPDGGRPGLKLGVKAGGCSGLNYNLEIVEEPGEARPRL